MTRAWVDAGFKDDVAIHGAVNGIDVEQVKRSETKPGFELTASARHVRTFVSTMPATLIRRTSSEVWTTTKVLRRLAWHERSELITMHHIAHRARAAIRGMHS